MSLPPSQWRRAGWLGRGVAVVGALLGATGAIADYRVEMGWTALQAELGAQLPTGAGARVTMVEASVSTSPLSYLPDVGSFAGKTIVDATGSGGPASWHANTVGVWYFGTASLSPGVSEVIAWEANHYLGNGFLRWGSSSVPRVVASGLVSPVHNQSWIGDTDQTASNTEILRRLDFAADRDGFVPVVGTNNGSGNPVPPLLSGAYNVLSVGLDNGNHAFGTVTIDGATRTKPDLVASADTGATSFGTPLVSSLVVLLHGEANRLNVGTAAQRPEVLRALVLAGTTQASLPGWARTTTQPLDRIYGAGLANFHQSWRALAGGQKAAGSTAHGERGWNQAQLAASQSHSYRLQVPPGYRWRNWQAALTWNRRLALFSPTLWFGNQSLLANLSLRVAPVGSAEVLQQSDSPGGSVELLQTHLSQGTWEVVVQSAAGDPSEIPYALAWHGWLEAVPTTFAAWQSATLTGVAQNGPTDDPDGDGLSNFLEYALGGDPVASGTAPTLRLEAAGSGQVDFVHPRRIEATGLVYLLEESTDGMNWVPAVGFVWQATTTAQPDGLTVLGRWRGPAPTTAGTPRFLRMRAEAAPAGMLAAAAGGENRPSAKTSRFAQAKR